MRPVVLFRDPDRVLLSTLAVEAHTGIDLTTVRIGNLPLHLNRRLSSNISLGDSSAGVVPEDADGNGAPTLIFPSRSLTSHINDNYWVVPTVQLDTLCQTKVMAKTLDSLGVQTINNSVVSKTLHPQDVCCRVVSHVRTVHSHGLPQRKGVSSGHCLSKIKHVKGVFCVNPCLSVPPVPNIPSAVAGQIVGGRLQQFWHIWQEMGENPRVVSVLKDDYSLPFSQRSLLTRVPLVHSGYANPTKSHTVKESLLDLIGKRVVEKVVIKSSLALYNWLFLVLKPNRKWRPILDLSQLNLYLKASSFKMETPETIRLSLQTGEWVTSLDFSDAYFHIPINPRSRKYLRFFLSNQTFQFTALPFGLATAPLEFTKVVKEVKLMAQARAIRIHQYLDDWLLRAQCQETCLQDTQTLLALCQKLGWVVNMKKSELDPQQIFSFVGYRFDLVSSRVLPTQDRWIALQEKLIFIKNRSSCTSFVRASSYETDSMAFETSLARSRSLEKVIPVPPSLHPHLDWWLDESNVLGGQPLHPLEHAL